MTKVSLQCRECKNEYDSTFKYICDECFGPLDVKYDFPSITKNSFVNREHTYWRYYEMLPIQDKSNIVSLDAGMTPLIHAKRLGEKLGLNKLYIKNDSVNPTFSFKDRPADIEHAKIAQALSYGAKYIAVDGTYDDANRIAAQIGDSKGIGIVNINMRSYYVEGSKTLAFEVAEQLDWNVPDQLIVPVGSGAMLNAICKGFEELQSVSLLNDVSSMHVVAAQPHGCAPIVDAYKKKSNDIIPVEYPDTVAKSLAIGDPGDGRYVLKRLQQYNGLAEESNNKEILDAILLLARTEGIFTEPAGGVSVAVLKKLADDGKIDKNENIICYVTGNGLKATESIMEILPMPEVMQADISKISAVVR